MKRIAIAMIAGSIALSAAPIFAADTTSGSMSSDQPKAESKTERAKEYVQEKAHNAKVKTTKAAKKTKKKTKEVIANRKTTDPASPNESKPDAMPAK